MKKIIKNTLINILLLSPLIVVTIYFWDNETFKLIAVGLGWTILFLAGCIAVIFGFVRLIMSVREAFDKTSEMYKTWRRAKVSVNNDDRLEKCSKCKGLGYVYWINNINGNMKKE